MKTTKAPPKRNRSAPKRSHLRDARFGLIENIAGVLDCDPRDDLLEAVEAHPRYRFHQGTQAARHFNDLLTLDVFLMAGGRLAATWWRNNDHLLEYFTCHDGVELPALLMHPAKGLPLSHQRPKVMPPELYRELRAGRRYIERAAEIKHGVQLA